MKGGVTTPKPPPPPPPGSASAYNIRYVVHHGMHVRCYKFPLVTVTLDPQKVFNPSLTLKEYRTNHECAMCISEYLHKYFICSISCMCVCVWGGGGGFTRQQIVYIYIYIQIFKILKKTCHICLCRSMRSILYLNYIMEKSIW